MKIQRKFQITALSLLITIGIICILISRNISTNIITKQITNNLINTTQSRTNHIETLLDEYKGLIKTLATEITFRDALNENIIRAQRIDEVNQRIKTIIKTHEEISRVSILDKEGIIIASSRERTGIDKSTDEIFLMGKQRVFIGDLHLSSFTNKYVLSIAAPILLNNQFAGVLAINLDAGKELFKITTDRTGLGPTGEVFLVNKDGYMITPSRFIDDVILKQKVDLKHIKELNNTEPSLILLRKVADIVKDYRGIEVLAVHTHIPEMGWYLFAEINVQEAFAPVTQLTQSLLLLFIIILSIVIFISGYISKTITRPIRMLHEGTEEITKGNLDYKVGTTSPDEVGQLSRAFDEMATNLKKSREELEEYSRNLEKKVEGRTKDLEIDISKRKKAEEALRKSQQEFDSLFRNSPEALVYLDDKGIILDANLRFCKLFGYTLKEIKGRNIDGGMIHTSDKIEEGKKLSVKGLKGYLNYETIRKKKDGTLFHVSISATPLVIDGQPKGEIGVYIDISERIKLQNTLQESEKRLSYAQQATNDGIWDSNLESGKLYLNDNYYRMLGYEPGKIDITDKVFEELLHPQDKERVLRKIQECIEDETKDYSAEFRMKSKSGKWKWILSRGNVVSRDSNGKALRFLGTHVDISQRKEMEEALRESEEKFYSISYSALDAIFFIDNNSNITYCNKAAEKLFGYSKEEIFGKDLHKVLMPSKYHNDFKRGFRTFQKTGKGPFIGKTLELSAIKKNKEEFPISVSLSAVKLKDKWNAIGIIRDISQHKNAEEKLKKLARIDSLTGCYNRRYTMELLDRQIKLSHRSKSPLLLAFLDIDGFKSINDNFGHEEGDEVLKKVVGLFNSTLREVDIICRMGGDEFLLIFPDNSLKKVALIKSRLEKKLSTLNKTIKKNYQIKFSMGFSEYLSDKPKTLDELINIADRRMYKEKKG